MQISNPRVLIDRKGFEFKVLSEDVIEGGYPRLNGHGNVVYVTEPVNTKNPDTGEEGWFILKMLEGGYMEPSYADNFVGTEIEAEKWAKHINNYNGFTPEEVEAVRKWSYTSTPPETHEEERHQPA